jgi:soluble lytic murein transglycosylase-like protein
VQAIIQVESRGNPRAVSPKGAKGLMQLMPSVLKAYQVEDPFDPLANLEAGVRHLKYLLGEFSGNLSLALAAYNAGPANVKKYGGIPPFPETQKYLFRVLREYQNEGIFPEPLRQSLNRSGKPARPESAGNPSPAPSRELHASLKSPPPAR